MSTEKGSFNAEIASDVIEAALRSVEKRSEGPGPSEVSPSAEVEVPIESAAPEASPEQREIESLKAQLEFSTAKGRETLEKLREAHEKMLRAVADLDNFKKRAAKEKEEVQKFGVERLLKDFLPVADNIDRALEHARGSADPDGLLQGVEMIRKLLEDTLGKHGVKGFTAVGKAFDPRLHEAIQQQETADVAENTVVAEMVRGYTLNERLVRPALVVVAKSPPAAAASPETNG